MDLSRSFCIILFYLHFGLHFYQPISFINKQKEKGEGSNMRMEEREGRA